MSFKARCSMRVSFPYRRLLERTHIHNWGQVLLQLSVYFPDGVKAFLQ